MKQEALKPPNSKKKSFKNQKLIAFDFLLKKNQKKDSKNFQFICLNLKKMYLCKRFQNSGQK